MSGNRYVVLPADGVIESNHLQVRQWAKLCLLITGALLIAVGVSLAGLFPWMPVGIGLLIAATAFLVGGGFVYLQCNNDQNDVSLSFDNTLHIENLERLPIDTEHSQPDPPVRWRETTEGGQLEYDFAENKRRIQLSHQLLFVFGTIAGLHTIVLLALQPEELFPLLLVTGLVYGSAYYFSAALLGMRGELPEHTPLTWFSQSQQIQFANKKTISRKLLAAIQCSVAVVINSTRETGNIENRTDVHGWIEVIAVLQQNEKVHRHLITSIPDNDLHSLRALQSMCDALNAPLLNHATSDDFKNVRAAAPAMPKSSLFQP